MIFNEIKKCVVCGVDYNQPLCKKHRKYYRFVKRYGFFALKPKKRISKPQTRLFLNIRNLFKFPTYQEVIFEFNIFRRYDIVVPDLKLILEYDGKQHFVFNKLFHKTKERFEDLKAQEIIKENYARGHGYTVLRFSYIEDVENLSYIEKRLKLKGFDKEVLWKNLKKKV